jgi:hypothetical protein
MKFGRQVLLFWGTCCLYLCSAVRVDDVPTSVSKLHGATSKTNFISAMRTSKLKDVFMACVVFQPLEVPV